MYVFTLLSIYFQYSLGIAINCEVFPACSDLYLYIQYLHLNDQLRLIVILFNVTPLKTTGVGHDPHRAGKKIIIKKITPSVSAELLSRLLLTRIAFFVCLFFFLFDPVCKIAARPKAFVSDLKFVLEPVHQLWLPSRPPLLTHARTHTRHCRSHSEKLLFVIKTTDTSLC